MQTAERRARGWRHPGPEGVLALKSGSSRKPALKTEAGRSCVGISKSDGERERLHNFVPHQAAG